jgi:hypothetical protein
MSNEERPKMPRAQIIYGEVIYWTTIVAALICMIGPVISIASPENNVLNPYYLFNAIFDGREADDIWREIGGMKIEGERIEGGHFYLKHFTYGDGFTQFGLALGCGCALWGLLAAALAYLKEKHYIYVVLAIWVAALIFLSMVGIVSGGH